VGGGASGWDLNFVKPARLFQGHTNGVNYFDVTTAGTSGVPTRVTTAGGDGCVKLYDYRSCGAELTLWAHAAPATHLQYIDANLLLTSGLDGRLRMWDVRYAGRGQVAKPFKFGAGVHTFNFDGTKLIVGTEHQLWVCNVGLDHLKRATEREDLSEVRPKLGQQLFA
jgi:WD40 repeat protein